MTYDEWIREYLASIGKPPKGMCGAAVEAMKLDFPELRRVYGAVSVTEPEDRRPHWWLLTPDDTIVDPTATQFEQVLEYFPTRVETP